MQLIKFSLKRPITVLMIYLLIIIAGIISFFRLPIDFLPSLSYPQLTIITIYENSSPHEIETQISQPIEEVVSTLKGVRKVKSISRDEVSVITLKFNWGTDMSYAALNLREKLDNIRHLLPENAERSNIVHLDPSEDPIMYIALNAKDANIIKIQALTENFIKRKLQQLDGVASADLIGNIEREIQITLDKQKIDALNLNLNQIGQKIRYANFTISGGVIKKAQYRYNVKIIGEYKQVEDIENTAILKTNDGTTIYLKDIAKVKDSFKDRKNITRFNKYPSLGLLIRKEANSNTVKVCSILREEIENLKQEYPNIGFKIAVDQSLFIKESIYSVLEAIFLGGFLAFLVLLLFLNDIRSPIQISLVIPISILTTFILIYFGKISLNIISLSGLALGVGMLVDNSIVVSESIVRNKTSQNRWKEAAYTGTKEVGKAITASTLTTLAVFLPILYVKGIASALFRQQALTVTFSLLSSLFVSLTMLPLLTSLRDKRKSKKLNEKSKIAKIITTFLKIIFSPFILFYRFMRFITSKIGGILLNFINRFQSLFHNFSKFYALVLDKALKRKKNILILFLSLFILILLLLFNLDKQFFPEVEQYEFTIQISTESGTPLEKTDNIVALVEQKLQNDKRVKSYFTSVGKSTEDRLSYYLEKVSKENLAEIKVKIKQNFHSNRVIADYVQKLKKIPANIHIKKGNNIFSSFLELEEADLIVTLEGDDLAAMKQQGLFIKNKLLKTNTFTNIYTDFETMIPMIKLRINRDKAALYNIQSSKIAMLVRTNVSGDKISELREFDKTYDITLRNEKDLNMTQLLNQNIIIENNKVPLRELVEISYINTLEEIKRIDQNRRLSIFCGYTDKLEQALAKLDEIIQSAAQEDIRMDIEGVNQEINQSLQSLLYALIFALVLVYMILASQFESLKLPFIIMFVAPMGVIGVSLSLFISNTTINMMSTLGMIILSGIIVNDAILLIDLINQLHKKGYKVQKAVKKAAQIRLRPILMTTFTTIFGLLPLALGIGSGAELQSALAIAVIGGILSATFLTLILIPVLFTLMVKD